METRKHKKPKGLRVPQVGVVENRKLLRKGDQVLVNQFLDFVFDRYGKKKTIIRRLDRMIHFITFSVSEEDRGSDVYPMTLNFLYNLKEVFENPQNEDLYY